MAVYTFSLLWFIVGLLIMALGAAISLFYNKFADASGFSSYSKWRIAGLIIIGIGLIFMLNIHTYLLLLLVQAVISGM
jgi:uncharacterized membrane protein YczE